MSTNKKSAHFVQEIISCKTPEVAVKILQEVVKELHLSSAYTDLVYLKDALDLKKTEYEEISNTYRSLAVPRSYEDIHSLRTNLNFMFRDLGDSKELTFKINQLKIFFEERKKVQVAESKIALKNNPEFKAHFGNKKDELTASALDDNIGYDPDYNEWTSCCATAYGLYKDLDRLLTSIRMMIDSMASEEKFALITLQKDVK